MAKRYPATSHWIFLGLAVIPLALAAVLQAPGGESVVIPILNVPLPELCTFKRLVGVDCPGCGLTRCFISLAHGDVVAAWRYNPAGILLFAAAVFQIPFRVFQLARMRRGLPAWRSRALDACLLFIAIALFVQWVFRTLVPSWA